MHIEVEKEQLLRYLEYVSRVSTKHQTLPVLQCVLITAESGENTASLRATNLELGIEAKMPRGTQKQTIETTKIA